MNVVLLNKQCKTNIQRQFHNQGFHCQHNVSIPFVVVDVFCSMPTDGIACDDEDRTALPSEGDSCKHHSLFTAAHT